MGGQKNAWCINLTRLLRCLIVCTLCAACWVLGVTVGVIVVSGKCHRPVVASRVPVRMWRSPSCRWQASASYVMLYPASQKTAVDSSDACDSPGTICALVAAVRNPGMARSQVCVERNVAPLGSKIEMGFVASCLLHTGASVVRKWPVAPVSLMAVSDVCAACVGCWTEGVSSSSSSSNPLSISNLLCELRLVGVTTFVEEKVTLFILSSTNVGAPPRQARCGSGLTGMMVLCTALRDT